MPQPNWEDPQDFSGKGSGDPRSDGRGQLGKLRGCSLRGGERRERAGTTELIQLG